MPKINREKFKVWGNVFDEFTSRTLFKLISEGYFEGLESPISIGKESNLFSALGRSGRVMVKIYRLEACDFNKMYDYLKDDPRYTALKGKKRQIILTWVQREYRNLMKAREANVRVPTPLTIKNNVLVLEFIGEEENAPKLKDQWPEDPKKFFDEIVENISRFYRAGLVHADLSAFNILNFNEHPVLIDFSQATPLNNPRAEEFLERDIKNLCTFFEKKGMDVSREKVLAKIRNKKF